MMQKMAWGSALAAQICTTHHHYLRMAQDCQRNCTQSLQLKKPPFDVSILLLFGSHVAVILLKDFFQLQQMGVHLDNVPLAKFGD